VWLDVFHSTTRSHKKFRLTTVNDFIQKNCQKKKEISLNDRKMIAYPELLFYNYEVYRFIINCGNKDKKK
jgi:hypothetical protein